MPSRYRHATKKVHRRGNRVTIRFIVGDCVYHGARKISIARFSMKNLSGACPVSIRHNGTQSRGKDRFL